MPEVTRHPPPTDEDDRRALVRKRLDEGYPRLQSGVKAIALKAGIRDGNEIDELFGEMVQEVIEQAHKYDPARELVPWALGFLRPLLKNRTRQQARRPVPFSDVSRLGEDHLLAQLENARQTRSGPDPDALHEWLRQLPDQDRAVIQARYFDGHTGIELAQAIGAPSRIAVALRLHRALQRLRTIAERDCGGAS